MLGNGLSITTQLHERKLVFRFSELPAQADGLRICLVADLHVRKRMRIYDRIVEYLRSIEFDLGCCVGDLQHGSDPRCEAPLAVAGAMLDATRPRLGWFYVRGNHDRPAFVPRLEKLGFHHLRNAHVRLLDSSPPVVLAGVDDPHRRRHDVAAALEGVSRDDFTVLLAHSADIIHEAEARGVRLVLAGHTHGGQIRLPWAGALYTQLRVSNEFAWGPARKGVTTVYTTSGIGTAHLPLRINCPPEIVTLTLRRGSGPHEDSGPMLI